MTGWRWLVAAVSGVAILGLLGLAVTLGLAAKMGDRKLNGALKTGSKHEDGLG